RSEPLPSVGSPPSTSGAPGGRTSAPSTSPRYRSASRSTMRSASARASRSSIGSAIPDTIYGVLAVVVNLGPVLVPESAAAAPRHLLRADHHVVDAVPPHKVHRGRVAVDDLLVVGLLLSVVGETVRPEPARVTDQLAAPGQRRDRAVVLLG